MVYSGGWGAELYEFLYTGLQMQSSSIVRKEGCWVGVWASPADLSVLPRQTKGSVGR